MQAPGDHDRLALRLGSHPLNMFLELCHILRPPADLHAGLTGSLTRDVESHVEFFFQLFADASVRSNQFAMLIDGYIESLSGLVFSFIHKCVDGGQNAFNHVGGTLDGKIVGFFTLARKANVFGAGARAASFSHDVLNIGTYGS